MVYVCWGGRVNGLEQDVMSDFYNIFASRFSAFAAYLYSAYNVAMPTGLYWYCSFRLFIMLTSSMCSNLFIVSMTFQRFYSIIQPHKSASFNTVKRAKITIACIVIFSFIFRFPHLFTTYFRGRSCFTFGNIWGEVFAQLYYWLTFTPCFCNTLCITDIHE